MDFFENQNQIDAYLTQILEYAKHCKRFNREGFSHLIKDDLLKMEKVCDELNRFFDTDVQPVIDKNLARQTK